MTLYVVYFKVISQHMSGIPNKSNYYKSDFSANGAGWKVEKGSGHLNVILFTP